MLWSLVSILPLLSLAAAKDIQPTEECPLLGPTYSSDFDLTETNAFSEAKKDFPGVVKKIFEDEIVDPKVSSFTIDVFSTFTNKSIYSYSHQATEPSLNESFPEGGIGDKTIIRVGSVSKLFTVYAILAQAGGLEVFDHSVTKYLPELAQYPPKEKDNTLESFAWENITIGALATHQAGTGQFANPSIACFTPEKDNCSTSEFLREMLEEKVPSQPVFQSPLYSDGGFGVLGRVLEKMTGKNYNDAIQIVLSKPLGLKDTGSIIPKGDDVDAIIIPGGPPTSAWGFDNQLTAPSGGIYSNHADLRTLGLSILQSKLLTPSETRAWMKPRGHTSSLVTTIGAPWEINRLTLPVAPGSKHYRVSDLYTKGGGQPGYTAIFALSPDHGIGFSVLVAGPTAGGDRWPIRAAVGETFVAAAEHAAKENAAKKFSGVFGDGKSNMTLTVEKDHVGLGMENWYVDGVEWRANITQPALSLPKGKDLIVRLYPTGLETTEDDGSTIRQYRAVPEITPLNPRPAIEGGKGLFDDRCITWFSTAFYDLETGIIDEFHLKVRNGELVAVISKAAEKVMKRKNGGKTGA
ncbi:hypothetical protein AJ79_05911 [Helicocarpus griseus UAMH5409]|uniref:Uncharacterized protein n=1 Tax=Helicocarpus griseus UAMH5409 TaxID=1447875 RepID=A0A2B7XIG6_9EURO|nr:hypothetical protein AJ79_05911 [Helicocarpus griseus UAMH5409]